MRSKTTSIPIAALLSLCLLTSSFSGFAQGLEKINIQLGPRPYYLVDQLQDGALKQRLSQCAAMQFKPSNFSISHRGAPLQFPEHTREAYMAAARMGAGIIECDVTFTKDKQLVCRHAQCDLHRTTNILTIPALANKCTQKFSPANAETGQPATAQCCASDITLAEFLSLSGKMDSENPKAKTVEEYIAATPSWRTDLYSPTATLMSFSDSIDLFKQLGVKMTPELKEAEVAMPFDGNFSQQQYATAVVELLKAKNVDPSSVFLQSFSWPDITFWLDKYPEFAKQAVFLDDRVDEEEKLTSAINSLNSLHQQGLNIIAPPMWALLSLDREGNIIPSKYALKAKAAGLDIITWTLERSGFITENTDDYYYQSIQPAIKTEGDIYRVLQVLQKDIGVLGVFSDWPATVTYYANCMGL